YRFFFNDTATTEIYTLSLHDALPIWLESSHKKTDWLSQRQEIPSHHRRWNSDEEKYRRQQRRFPDVDQDRQTDRWRHGGDSRQRSEEHTSELQSLAYLVCRLLLEKKK